MKIIVTGGAGFIGSQLLRLLFEEGGHELLNIDKLCFPGSIHTIKAFESEENYRFVQEDIANQPAMLKIFEDFAPDAVFHLAAESHVDRSIDSPKNFIDSNIAGTFSLLEGFRHYYRGLPGDRQEQFRFVHVSTDEVYGSLSREEEAFSETSPFRPSSPYAATKAASDHLVSAWHTTYGLPLITTNCSNNYGPFQFPEKLIPVVITRALAGETIPVYGKGDNVRDWLYVEDHARALIRVMQKGQPGTTYNIGAENELDNLTLVKTICDLLDEIAPGKTRFRDQIQFVEDRPGHDFRYAIDNSRICKELGWHAKENFQSGIEKTLRWYLDNQEWCRLVCEGSYDGRRQGLGLI